jgi:hypothetical protein
MTEMSNAVPTTSTQSSAPTAISHIDIEKLTEKVYQLMRADLRLARARNTTHRTRK